MNKEQLEEYLKKMEEMYWELKDSIPARMLKWRRIDGPGCVQCEGAGVGVGKGFMRHVCDKCWGSGDDRKPWQSWDQ